jgi:ZIP family zinc transporter
MDGIGIGLGFQVSKSVGILVAIAVISHDFCDGLNTVSLMLVNRNTIRRSLAMLLLDALAPVLGAASTLIIHVSATSLMLYLGFFAGFLLYIGASDILPEAHSQNRSAITLRLIGLTFLGALVMFFASRMI